MVAPVNVNNSPNTNFFTNPLTGGPLSGLGENLANQINEKNAAPQQLPPYLNISEDRMVSFGPDTTNSQVVQTLKLLGLIEEDDYSWFQKWFGESGAGDDTWMAQSFNDPDNDLDDRGLDGFNQENKSRFERVFGVLNPASRAGGIIAPPQFANTYLGPVMPGQNYAGGETTRPVFIGQPPTGGSPEQPFYSQSDILVSSAEQPNLYDVYDPYAPFVREDPYSSEVILQYPYQPPEGRTPPFVFETTPATPLSPMPEPFIPDPIVPSPEAGSTMAPVSGGSTLPSNQLTFGGEGVSGTTGPKDVFFDLYDVNLMGTTPAQKTAIQSYLDSGRIDSQGRLITEGLSRDDLYQMAIGGFGIGASPLHRSLIDQARAAFAGDNILYNQPSAPEPQLTFGGESSVPANAPAPAPAPVQQTSFAEQRAAEQQAAEQQAAAQRAAQQQAAQQVPEPQLTFGGESSVPANAPAPALVQQTSFAEQRVAEQQAAQRAAQQAAAQRAAQEAAQQAAAQRAAQEAAQRAAEQRAAQQAAEQRAAQQASEQQAAIEAARKALQGGIFGGFSIPSSVAAPSAPAPTPAPTPTQPVAPVFGGLRAGVLPNFNRFAEGGIVSTSEQSMPVNGGGIESFLMKYQSPDSVAQERRAATLRKNLAALQPQPTAPGPRPTMQQGIMPMARPR